MATMMMAGIGFGIDKLFGKRTPVERAEDLHYPEVTEETLREQVPMAWKEALSRQSEWAGMTKERIDAMSMMPGGVVRTTGPSKSSAWDTTRMSTTELEEWKEHMLSDMLRVREKAEAEAKPDPDSVTITKESMLNLLDHVKSLEERVKAIEVNTHHEWTEAEVEATEERLYRPTPAFIATGEDTYHLDMTDTPLVDGGKL
jgi:hypothetical protein